MSTGTISVITRAGKEFYMRYDLNIYDYGVRQMNPVVCQWILIHWQKNIRMSVLMLTVRIIR